MSGWVPRRIKREVPQDQSLVTCVENGPTVFRLPFLIRLFLGSYRGSADQLLAILPPLSLETVPEVFAKVNSVQFSSCFLRGGLEGGMGPIGENTHVNRKWGFLPFHLPWRQQIWINKILFSFKGDLPGILNQPLPNDAKSPLPVDVRRSKTLMLKLTNMVEQYSGGDCHIKDLV